MCRPLKDIIAELEEKYGDLLYDLEERRRYIALFDHDVAYVLKRLEDYEEDVKYIRNHGLDANIIKRITHNLVLICHQFCSILTAYYYSIDCYLLDEYYDKNQSLWSKFINIHQNVKKLIEDFYINNVFETRDVNESEVISEEFYEANPLKESGVFSLRKDFIDKMNGRELMICLHAILEIIVKYLHEIKFLNLSRSNDTMTMDYWRNYLLYAKKYWPTELKNFRPHIEYRLRNKVNVNELLRLRHEAINEFEYHTVLGKIWCDYSEDKGELAIQLKEQNLDERCWKEFFSTIFKIEEFDRWIEELRNPPESEEEKQKRARLLKSNKVFTLQPTKSEYDVDILLLYVFIRDRFISEKMFVYEWYALYHILKRNGILTNCTTEDFVTQMNDVEWFGRVNKRCKANEINTYHFLDEIAPDVWEKEAIPVGNRASQKSVDNLYRKYSELEDTLDEIYKKV